MNRRLLQQGSDDSNGHLPDHQQYPTLNRAPRIQGPEDPLRTIHHMNRRLLQQGSDNSNGHLPDHQQYPTPNRAPTATANDQHVPAGPYHRLPSSDAILSPRPPSTLNRFAGYTGPTQNSQSPHQQQQPHSLVQAQSPTASQGYSQFPGVGPNSSVFSNLGSLPQQFNTGIHQPQLLTIPAPLAIPGQLAMNGNQPAEPSVGPPFVNPRTGAVYDSDPRYPMTKDEKEFFESEGYTYPEPINPFSGMDIFDDSAETPFQWPAIPNALPQTGYGATPMNGTNGAASMNGTHGAAPMYGMNGVAHMNGTNGAAPMNGTHGVAHINGTNGAASMNGTNGAASMHGTNGVAHMNGTNGTASMNGTHGAAPMHGTNGVAHMNGTNGAAPMNATNGRLHVNVTRPSAGLNASSGPGDCQCDPCHCGPGCTCVYCRAHPYNSPTTERVQELGRILERDLQLPQPEHGVITMLDSSYHTLTYPMAHSRDDNCTGVSATCPCGSGCTCAGCLAHAGQH